MTRVKVEEIAVGAVGALVVETDRLSLDVAGAHHVDPPVLPTNRFDEWMTNTGDMPCQNVDFFVDPHRAYILPCVRT